MIPSCLKEEIIMSSQRKAKAATSENIVTTETSSLSDLWKKEDWLAVWIGFIIIAVGAVAVITGAFDFNAAKFSTWGHGTSFFEQVNAGFFGKLILTVAVLGVLFTVGNYLKGLSVKKYLPAFLGLFLLAVLVRFISAEYTLNRYLEWAFFAILIGILVSNTIGVPAWLKPAIQTEFYIKVGLVIMGFSVLFSNIVNFGLYGMGISGTRAAMGVIMGGMLMITVIAKNWKALLAGIFISISVFVFFSYTNIGSGNQYIHKMRSSFHPSEDASYQVRVENRQRMKELMAKKPLGYGIGLSKAGNFDSREQMPYPPDSWLVSVWVETGIVGLILYLSIHGILFAWCSWILMFKVRNKGLRGLIAAWLCMDAGFFIATYVNDIMQYPNQLPVYIGFALCFAAPHIDKRISEKKEESEEKERQLSNNETNEQE